MNERINPDAYKPSSVSRVVEVNVTLMLDPVPGAWHDPDDFLLWVCRHSYVQSARVIANQEQPQ